MAEPARAFVRVELESGLNFSQSGTNADSPSPIEHDDARVLLSGWTPPLGQGPDLVFGCLAFSLGKDDSAELIVSGRSCQ